MDISNWGGAQWVLLTYYSMTMLFWIGFRFIGKNQKHISDWLADFIYHVITVIALLIVLYWGGFWA